jgi:glutathione S-transferase
MSDQRIASNDLTVWTYDWVPEGPRGHVRDIRLRWALEEAGLDYAVRTVPFDDRGPEHLARQPFGQVPFLEDGDIILFESGACLLHLGRKSETLMPRDPRGRGGGDAVARLGAQLGGDGHRAVVVRQGVGRIGKSTPRLDDAAFR